MMILKGSQIYEKVCSEFRAIESAGVRNPMNNYTRLIMWMEAQGYNNEELAKVLVSQYNNQWTV